MYIKLNRKDGVSPVARNSLDKESNKVSDTKGLKEKIRFILLISTRVDLIAREAPIADAMSQEPRNVPVISS